MGRGIKNTPDGIEIITPEGAAKAAPKSTPPGKKPGPKGLHTNAGGGNSGPYKEHAAKNAKEKVDKKFGKGDEPPKSLAAPTLLPFENTLAFAFRNSGGKETAINAARLLQDQDIRFKKFVYAYDIATTRDKETITLESLCAAAGLTPADFLAEIVPALWRRSVDIGKITAAIAHPMVVEATIAQSMSPFGTQEKKMLLESIGFLPTSKGITIDNRHQTLINHSVGVEHVPGLPSFEDDGIESSRTIRGDESVGTIPEAKPKLIEASEDILDAEIIEMERAGVA